MEITTIDCHYTAPEFAAAFLVVSGGEAMFVENNTAHAVPRLLETLKEKGLSPEAVKYVAITHVHLDHAGGSSALMKACPNAVLLAHPRAARHVIDPSKLVASARAVYGDAQFRALYGEIDPVPAERVRALDDGAVESLGGERLRFFHTRGHANHHFCIHAEGAGAVFTGDTFGLQYPFHQTGGRFIFPSTSPTDFDPAAAKESVRRIVDTGASRAFLTHFGEVTGLDEAAAQLIEHLDFSEALLERAKASGLASAELEAFCDRELRGHYTRWLEGHRMRFTDEQWRVLELDLKLNAQGIAFVAQKPRA